MNQVAKVEKDQAVSVQNKPTPEMMLMAAVEKGVDTDQLSKLMDLQDRWNASEAKKAFSSAMAEFQSKLEPIIKKRAAHNSKYADIDDIAQSIRPILASTGLSYRFEQKQTEGSITVSCIVTHRFGHSETTTLSAAADKSGGKNDIQSIASAVTYLRRYTLTGALGITTGQDDNDGGKPDITVDELLNYMSVLRENFYSVSQIKTALLNNEYAAAKEALAEITQDDQMILWRAPTKGGVFTTEERTKIKSNEWAAA